jgi:mRNA interferase MazF
VRGDVHVLKAPKGARGHEQQGRRLALVVQNDDVLLSTWLVAPTSTSAQFSRIRPEVEISGRSTLILVDQTMAIDPTRLGSVVGHLSHADMAEVDRALKTVLGLR